jgi:4-amino-4-deoxy-L-arabinose transferase-like glycosyltransferase
MNQHNPETTIKWLYFFIVVAVAVNFSGLFIPITGPDGALYALIAKTMVQRNDYVQLFDHGKDWLDKPHFPFWITAISFKLFGFTTWAYKLPAILFLLMGAGYTYLFAKALYNKQIALWSVLILLTAQHIILSNNDVRAEPYLTGLIIAAVYHFYQAHTRNNYWALFFGCLFTACAIMTKGMFAIIPIGGTIAGHIVITGQWKQLVKIKWLIAVILVLLMITPELWCLYRQFDAHPEKVIFGQHAVSGIKFFFWDSQFGRFFNTGPIKGHGDPSFFVHTALWAFLPWSLLMFAAIFKFIRAGVKDMNGQEWYCISGALLTFLLFSASRFQLPHYLNIVFPFFAIITAQYLYHTRSEKTLKAVRLTQTVLIVLLLLIISTLQYYFRAEYFTAFTACVLVALLILLILLPGKIGAHAYQKTGFRTLIAAFMVNLYLNLAFYPSLLHYQAGSEAAMWININNPQQLPVAELADDYVTAFDFYIDKPVSAINADGTGNIPPKPFLLYATADVIKSLTAKGWQVQKVKSFERYWITRLKPAFLNQARRAKELTVTEVVLVK